MKWLFFAVGALLGIVLGSSLGVSKLVLNLSSIQGILQDERVVNVSKQLKKSREALQMLPKFDSDWKSQIEENIRQRNEQIKSLQEEALQLRELSSSTEKTEHSDKQRGHEVQSVNVN